MIKNVSNKHIYFILYWLLQWTSHWGLSLLADTTDVFCPLLKRHLWSLQIFCIYLLQSVTEGKKATPWWAMAWWQQDWKAQVITDECQKRGIIPPDKMDDEFKQAVNTQQDFTKLTESPMNYISIPEYSYSAEIFKGCSMHSRQKVIDNDLLEGFSIFLFLPTKVLKYHNWKSHYFAFSKCTPIFGGFCTAWVTIPDFTEASVLG